MKENTSSTPGTMVAANILRSYCESGDNPEIPVDPVRIARLLKINVFVAPLSKNATSVLIYKDDFTTEIYLSADQSIENQRMSCARELAFYMKNMTDEKSEDHISYRNETFAQWMLMPSFETHFFAELLMPKSSLSSSLNITYLRKAELYRVCPDVMLARVAALGIT